MPVTMAPQIHQTFITVGASTETDVRASYSNFGSCVTLFAPGNQILSAGIGSPTATRVMSGSSMASPMVAGAAALYLQSNPNENQSQVKNAIVANATNNILTNVGVGFTK
jgi:subtilisin family serine protease